MGSQNDGDPKDTKAPRRSRLFEVSPPPEAAASEAAPTASEAPPASEPASEPAPPEEPPAEPLTEPVEPIASEDMHSVDSVSMAPVEDASDASIKLARDARMKKPVPAASDISKSKGGETLVRRSAPAVDLHPTPRRRGWGWLLAFAPALLLVAVLAWMYTAGYRIGPHGLVPPPHAATR
jgi:hypothetical protein